MEIPVQEVVLFLVSTFNLLIGIFILWKQPGRIVNRSFFLATAGISIWGFGLILLAQTHNFGFNTIMFSGFAVFIFGFVTFSRVFPNNRHLSRNFYFIFIPLLFIVTTAPFGLIIKGALYHPGNQPEPINGSLFTAFALISVFYFLFGLYGFVETYRTSQRIARVQINYLFFGLSVLLGSTVIFDMLMPAFGFFRLNFLGPISSIVLIGLTAYAIVRHELMDIKIVIQRGLIYTVLFIMFVGVYVIGLEITGYLLHDLTRLSAILSGALTTGLGILSIQPLERFFQKITDPVFFKDKYNYAESVHALSRIMYTNLREEDIIMHSESMLKHIFKTDTARIILDPGAVSELSEADQSAGFSTVARPITFEDKTVGVLRLGEKRSGDSYTPQDLQLVSTFTFQAAISLSKAKLYLKLEEYSTHLERLVVERTYEIKRLQEDQKQAMIDISHNLQTPLAIMRGEIELLTEDSVDAEKMHTVKKSLDRVSFFIRQLLYLARLEHSIYAVDREPLDLGELLKRQVEYFDVMAEESGVEMTPSIQSGLIILGNRRLLEELFTNLASNAIKYRHPERKGIVRISLKKKEGNAVVTVEDNGVGIPPETIPDLFARFYRSSSTPHTVPGTGLGLAIAKKIVEKHDGTIEVASTLGQRTVFTIIFPIFGRNK